MNPSELRPRLDSVLATIVTPFDTNGHVDYERLESVAEYMIRGGISLIVPAGNTGEFSSLSLDETMRVTGTLAGVIADKATVIAGVGGPLPLALQLAEHAQEVGAHGVMIHHPTHTYIDRVALRRYYDSIIASLEIGVVLYKRGPEVTDDLLRDLVQYDNVVGVKYAVNDLNAFANLVASASGSNVVWICGTAERWAPFFALAGATGFSSGLANFAPAQSIALLEALQERDYERAMHIRTQLTPLEELRQLKFAGNNVPVVKEALRQLGLANATVREPLAELSSAERLQVNEILVSWGMSVAAVA